MSSSCSDSHSQTAFDLFPPLDNDNQTTTSPPPSDPQAQAQTPAQAQSSPSQSSPLNANAAVFNISWGGSEDKPPAELCSPDQEVPALSRRPPPKPRGIRRLPEPEPAEDGSIDENTLKRRKVSQKKAIVFLFSVFLFFCFLLTLSYTYRIHTQRDGLG